RAAISARNVPTNGTTTVPLITARSNRATPVHSIPVPCTAVRGVLVAACGGLDAMQLAELPSPVPGPGHVLVEVHASGVNFAETRMRAGTYGGVEAPFVLGMESAGVVVGLGPG